LTKKVCEFCSKMDFQTELMSAWLEPLLLKFCHCRTGDSEECCCTKKVESFFSNGILKNEKEYVEHKMFDCDKYKYINKNFFHKQDPGTNTIRYFCLQSIKYRKVRNVKSPSLIND